MGKRVSIRDIAKRAGVSTGTVDRVLHNRGNVSPKAKERVLQAMNDLDYQRNSIASVLAYNRTRKIAVLIPDADKRTDEFWHQPQNGVQWASQILRDYGFVVDTYYFAENNTTHFTELGDKILTQDYDAVLVASIFYEEANAFFDKCCNKKLLYGQINTYIERKDSEFLFYVGQDSYHSGFLAAKLLNFGLESGSTAMILHLEKSVFNSAHLIEKEKGFEDYFRADNKNAIHPVKSIFFRLHEEQEFRKFVEYQLRAYPKLKGIFVTTSRMHHLVPILEDLGRPDIKLVGFDLTTKNLKYLEAEKIDFLINQNPTKQGYLGILNFMNYFILGKKLPKIQHLPLDIVVKENMHYYQEQKEKLHLLV